MTTYAGDAVANVLIEYEASGAERGEVQRMRVAKDEAVAAGDRIRAAGGKVLEWWLVADVRGLGERPSGKVVLRRIESARLAGVRPADEVCVCGVPGCPEGPDAPSDDLACIVVPHVPYQSQIAKDNAQAAKDLAHLLRLLGVDSYEEATVVLFDLARAGHLPRPV